MDDLKAKYEQARQQDGENARSTQRLAMEYNKQADSLNRMEHQLANYTKELNEMRVKSSSWYKMGDAMQGFGDKLGGVSKKAREVGSTLTKRITLPALGVATAAGGIVAAFGWDRLVGLDSAKAQLEGMGYSTKEVGSITDTVTTAIEGGMTTMAEGTAVAAGAMAAGVKEGKDLERYIKLVGDAAVGSNRPVDEMAQIFNRVQGGGKLMTQELNQIEHGMPGFSNALAKGLGVPVDKMREMVTAGEVSSDDFLDVMDDFAGGMAEAYANSWQGMVANTKAYIGIIGENLLGGVFEQSKESISEFIELLSSEEVQQKAAEIGESIGEAFTKIVDKAKDVVNWYKDLSEGQQQLILKVGAFAVAIGPLLTGFGILGGAIAKVSSGLGVFFKWLAPILTPLKGIGTAAAGSGKAFTVLRTVIGALTGPIGITIAVITALATAFITAYKKSETFRNFIQELGGTMKDIFNNIMEYVTPAFDAIKGFFGEMKQKIAEFMEEEGPGLTQAFETIGEIIGVVAGYIGDQIRDAFTTIKVIVEFVMPFIEEVIRVVWDAIKGTIVGTLDIIMGAVKIFSGIFTGDFSKMWDGVKQIFLGAINIVWGFVKNSFVGRIITAVAGFAINFRDKITNLWQKVKETFTQKAIEVYNKFKDSFVGRTILKIIAFSKDFRTNISNMWQRVKDKFIEKILEIYNKVKDSFVGKIITNIINFSKNFRNNISTMWDKVKNKFTTFINSIRNSIENSFVGKMLTSVRNLKTKFVNLAGDMWDGVKKQFNNIVDGAKGLPKRIGDGIKNAKNKATSGMKNVGNALIKTAGKPFNKVVDGVNWITKKFGGKGDIGHWDYPQYAKGTGGHPGGHAIMGDGKGSNAGSELVSLPNGKQFLSASTPTIYPNLPRGTQVLSAKDTKNLPAYAKGTFGKIASGIKSAGKAAFNKVKDVWEYASKPKELVKKVIGDIGIDSGLAKIPKDIAGSGIKYIKDKPVKYIKDKIGDFGFGGGNASGNVKSWISAAIAATGAPKSWQSALETIAMKESGGRTGPSTINKWDINWTRGTPSMGLMQTIRPTFEAYKKAGMNDIMNPIHNAVAAINYIKSRYGTPFNTPGIKSMSRGGPYKGYATGGLVRKMGLYPLAEDGHPEWIIPTDPKRRTDAMKLLALAGKDIGGNKRPNQLNGKGFDDDRTIDLLVEQNQLLKQLLEKETNVTINKKDMTDVVNEENALKALGNYF